MIETDFHCSPEKYIIFGKLATLSIKQGPSNFAQAQKNTKACPLYVCTFKHHDIHPSSDLVIVFPALIDHHNVF